MRQETIHSNALEGGRSFCYRDIFSGLSNEKMGPVLCIFMSVGYFAILSAYFIGILSISFIVITLCFFTVPSPRGQEPSYGKAFLSPLKCLCLLQGASLALLKTNFAKKPKNPV